MTTVEVVLPTELDRHLDEVVAHTLEDKATLINRVLVEALIRYLDTAGSPSEGGG